MTVLEVYVDWLTDQGLFDSIPPEINLAKTASKSNNTEQTYTDHLNMLVNFFIEQVPSKGVEQLQFAAEIVAQQQQHRRWNVTESIIKLLRSSHNAMLNSSRLNCFEITSSPLDSSKRIFGSFFRMFNLRQAFKY